MTMILNKLKKHRKPDGFALGQLMECN
ncbi:hypothetical protein AKJ16_DCAP25517 [Drosera capensis]